jgi:hypothetical protein
MKSRLSFLRQSFVVGLAFIITGAGAVLSAQEGPPASAPQVSTPLLSPQQIDNLVAPIALYPDPLLTQVMVAATYPLEVVEAQQWLHANSSLKGEALMKAAQQQPWDASVQAMVAFPDVLAKLNQDVGWTNALGNAFLAQQGDVMRAVQQMRASAMSNGKLSSTPQQTVTTQTQNGQPTIIIQPSDPQVIYVPTYDPSYVWGPPLWGAYPSLGYPGFGFGWGPGINLSLCFGGWGWGGWGGWGWGPNWFGGGVIINPFFFRHNGFWRGSGGFQRGGFWAHNPAHRLGVPYSNRQLASRFQAASRSGAMTATRNAFGPNGSANRSAMTGPQAGGRQFGTHPGAQGPGNRSMGPQGSMRGFQGSPSQSRPSMPAAPRSSGPSFGGSHGSFGGASRSFGGGGFGGGHGFGGGQGFGGGGFGGGHGFGGGGHGFGGGGHGGGHK